MYEVKPGYFLYEIGLLRGTQFNEPFVKNVVLPDLNIEYSCYAWIPQDCLVVSMPSYILLVYQTSVAGSKSIVFRISKPTKVEDLLLNPERCPDCVQIQFTLTQLGVIGFDLECILENDVKHVYNWFKERIAKRAILKDLIESPLIIKVNKQKLEHLQQRLDPSTNDFLLRSKYHVALDSMDTVITKIPLDITIRPFASTEGENIYVDKNAKYKLALFVVPSQSCIIDNVGFIADLNDMLESLALAESFVIV